VSWVVAHVCNPSRITVRRLRQKNLKFQASLGYNARTCKKEKGKKRKKNSHVIRRRVGC
jgi:hypothetical protein